MHTLEQLRAGALAGTPRLDLAAGLTAFPLEIFDLGDSLEVLNLSGNALSSLPADLGQRLPKLRVLFCSDNRFTAVPEALGQCPRLEMVGFKANRIQALPAAALPPALRWLILTDNQLGALPAEIGTCARLQKLMLAGNRLTELPATLAACTRLELLRIAANRLTELPPWLLAMPQLAWLAYAGNPFAAAAPPAAVAAIGWDALTLEQPLGEGASGIIYRAQWRRAAAPPLPVAVKVFKGAVTSDGLPQSEMQACIGAGAHPNLVAVHGQITGHPTGAEGLVLELIDPAFRNLAGPPSLASCTRDEYAPGATFSLATVLGIAQGIAAAAAHLHGRGILHGDLYAHNILTTASGQARLGDFGAASLFAPGTPAAAGLQRLETRAFGHLLAELLTRCSGTPAAAVSLTRLWALQAQCVQVVVAARPLFAEISQTLAAILPPADAGTRAAGGPVNGL